MDITWLEPPFSALGLSRSPGASAATRDEDLAVLVDAGVDLVVCLQEAHELGYMEPPETIAIRSAAVAGAGMGWCWEPIEDFEAPTLEQVRRLVELLRAARDAGQRVVVHCQAGLGRAGTVAACVLVSEGMSAAGAIAMVRWLRPGAVQSQAQHDLVEAFAARAWL